jgi:hypothetical protein
MRIAAESSPCSNAKETCEAKKLRANAAYKGFFILMDYPNSKTAINCFEHTVRTHFIPLL